MRLNKMSLQAVTGVVVVATLFAAAYGADRQSSSTERSSATRQDPPATLAPFSFTDLGGASLAWNEDAGGLLVADSVHAAGAIVIHVFQPDCGKCEALARALDDVARASASVAAAGIAHRLGDVEAREFVRHTGITYPVAVGTGSDWVRDWGRGDPLFIIDRRGRIAYRQTGFREDDVERWRAVIEDLAADRVPRLTTAVREHLETGDPLPRIELPDLMTGDRIALIVEDGELRFVDAGGRIHPYRASVGFFSRY